MKTESTPSEPFLPLFSRERHFYRGALFAATIEKMTVP
jgi:hypothetical protein